MPVDGRAIGRKAREHAERPGLGVDQAAHPLVPRPARQPRHAADGDHGAAEELGPPGEQEAALAGLRILHAGKDQSDLVLRLERVADSLERLLLAIAEKTQAIRAAGIKP